MNREEALKQLRSGSHAVRRLAAKALAENADTSDIEALRIAYRGEDQYGVKSYLRRALTRISTGVLSTSMDEPSRRLGYPEAVRTVTKELVHEIRHYVARMQVHIHSKNGRVNASALNDEIHRLSEFLSAMLRLADASAPAEFHQFDLSQELLERTQDELQRSQHDISFAGPIPLLVTGDARLVSLIFCNGLRNAIEACEAAETDAPIIINWGEGETDYWLAILDEGVGFPHGVGNAFDVGVSSKPSHLGMGLTMSRQAAETLGGTLTLSPREIGTLLELRWLKGVGNADFTG